MRSLQRRPVARLLVALVAGSLLTLVAWRVGLVVPLLLAASTALLFIMLTVLPDAIAWRRGHVWRWWERPSPEDGPHWPGTRLPRRPPSPK